MHDIFSQYSFHMNYLGNITPTIIFNRQVFVSTSQPTYPSPHRSPERCGLF